jgi:hypothetical protein
LIGPDFPGDVAHFAEDDGEGGLLVHSVQDVAPVLERNKALANHNDGYSASRELRRVAFIPNIVRLKWLNEEGWDAYRLRRAGQLGNGRQVADQQRRHAGVGPDHHG